ncbi:HEAT repeat-containing protein 3-like [Varroa destructor]|uniref:SYO1-like TPR repeats domain-containing protein n=1 Tax=Varroa destructor TaxID=109461 RepID=A0A7M7MCR3_VARDE|nr:HEAT repeat-containing protein 3-like [Varroa destructor]
MWTVAARTFLKNKNDNHDCGSVCLQMGKERVRRRHRFNPMAVGNKTSNEGSTSVLGSVIISRTTAPSCDSIENLVSGLKSTVVVKRASAAAVLVGLADDMTSRHETLRPEVIRAAAPLLLDDAVQVRCCIASWLREVSQAGPDVCGALVQASVLDHLALVLQELTRSGSFCSLEPRQSAILLDLLNVLTNLCENCEQAVEIVTCDRFISALFLLLRGGVDRVSVAAGQCLLTVTEDNPALESMAASEMGTLESILRNPSRTPAYLLLKATVAGIMHNLAAPTAFLPLLVDSAKAALEHEIATQISSVMLSVSRLLEVRKGRDLDIENIQDMEQEVDSSLIEVCETLQAKKTALELLVNLCCTNDEEDKWDNIDEDDEDAMSIHSSSTTGFRESISPEIQTAISSTQLLSAVFNHIGPLDTAILVVFREYKPARQIERDVHAVRCRALLCIDNLAQSFDMSQIRDIENIQEISKKILAIAFSNHSKNQIKDVELLEAASSACRAIFEALVRTGNHNLAPALTEEELTVLCRIVLTNDASAAGRVNITRIVGTLSRLQPFLINGVGRFLIKVASQDAELRVCSEALDALIDAFADDATDAAAREIDLVNEMRSLAPRFKQMLRASPKDENKSIAFTCYNNVLRFIKYKSKRLNKS